MLKIGSFSKLSMISIRMLRHYDEIGLLKPISIDEITSYRYYVEEQLPVAGRIVELRDMGFGLNAIGEIIQKYNDSKALAEFLIIKLADVKSEVEESNRRARLIDNAIKRLRKDDNAMNYNVVLKKMPKRYVASVRKTIPAYDQEGMLWNILMDETKSLNLQYAEDCFSLAIFHDDGYKENDVDIEIQMTVKGNYNNTQTVVFKEVPEFDIASATYKGNYNQLTEVNQAVATWVRDSGYEFDGDMFCIYHVSPAQTQNADEYITEVCYSIKKK